MMVLQIIEFIHSIIYSGRFKTHLKPVLSDLIYIMIVYMQITEEQIELWSDDPERFIQDDYQAGLDESIRIGANDVVRMLSQYFDNKLLGALSEALTRHGYVAEAEKAAGNPHWWKIHEASIIAVGKASLMIQMNPEKFDLTQYLNFVRTQMECQTPPYLLARCIWVLGRFAGSDLYNEQTLAEVLDATHTSLATDKSTNLRIYAVRTIYELCESLKDANVENRTLFVAKLPLFLDEILILLPQSRCGVLAMLLETLTLMISV